MNPDTPYDGPAFPVDFNTGPGRSTGMTLRDYFAAKAMQMLLAETLETERAGEVTESYDMARARIAAAAYEYADAMLKERVKVKGA